MILTAVILVVLANKDLPTYVYDGTKKIISSVIYSRRSNIWNTEKAIQVFNILEKCRIMLLWGIEKEGY